MAHSTAIAIRWPLILPSGEKIRNPWYDTTCCPPNLERTFASLPGYFYSTSKDGIYVHLYDNSELNWHLENGVELKVTQKTNYPWDGSVEIAVSPAQPSNFTFYLRIPGWAESAQVAVNGKAVTAKPGQYLPIARQWSAGDVIRLQMEMPVQVCKQTPRWPTTAGASRSQRGPLVYCLEEIDQPEGVKMSDLAVESGKEAANAVPERTQERLAGRSGSASPHRRGL